MSASWFPLETNTHQDHVIAHVLGTTVLGYFVFEEVLYLLLDIGFVWTIFLDAEMGLLPHPVAVGELEAGPQLKEELRRDIDLFLAGETETDNLLRMTVAPLHTDDSQREISEVLLFQTDGDRRVVLNGETSALVIQTSLLTRDFKVYDYEQRTT